MPFRDFAVESFPALLDGAIVTAQIVAVAIVIGFAIGVALALARVYGGPWLSRFAAAYVEVFRGTPLLVQLFVLYFGLPNVGIYVSSLAAAILGMGLNSAAYQSEYFRSALQSIRSGQMLAARAIGMTQRQALASIILPQTLRRALPSWTNELTYMIKYSSVAYMIQTPELMAAGKEIASATFRTFETYVVVALIYLVLVTTVGGLLRLLEARLRIPGL